MTPPPEKLAGSLDALRSLQSAASLPCAPRISRGRIASGSFGTGSCCGSSGAGTQSRHSLAARDVDLDEFRACCRDLVDRVVRRLLVLGIEGTFLQEECGGVQAADDDEAVFCKAAAGLGLDPYALDDRGTGFRHETPRSSGLGRRVRGLGHAHCAPASEPWVRGNPIVSAACRRRATRRPRQPNPCARRMPILPSLERVLGPLSRS